MAEAAKPLYNIGIFAHVDDGKTTLTEGLLKRCGAIRNPGSVDAGTAHTDRLAIERRRGISIKATCASMKWKGCAINLIDTPGHTDFLSEVERSFWAIDGAVLLLNGAEGIMPHTEFLFRALSSQGIPTVLFANKMDREGADAGIALAAREILSPRIVEAQDADSIHALLAEEDETALADYIEGSIYDKERLLPWLGDASRAGRAYPLLMGSALKGEGLEALLDAIVYYLPAASQKEDRLCGVVFALDEDATLGRGAHVRLFGGSLRNRESLLLPRAEGPGDEAVSPVKIAQIRKIPLDGRGEDLGYLGAGEIGAVYGLGATRPGQVIGDSRLLPSHIRPGAIAKPLFMVKVLPAEPDKQHLLKDALTQLALEDPAMEVARYGDDLHIRIMGAVQLEVLGETLETRFGLPVAFDKPNVIYRETIAKAATGFYAYTMPKPCWAIIEFYIEPLQRGSGVEFVSKVGYRDIMERYQHQIQQGLPLALRQGMLGWQVDDVRITLTGGEHHLIHTHPLDFIMTTPIAFMDGLRRGGSILLEPMMNIALSLPADAAGKVMGEIISMRGEILSSARQGDIMHLSAKAPLATSADFNIRLAAMTSGRGAMSMELMGYEDCDLALGATCPRRGVHPLDTAKYILAARSAVDGGIFNL